jgi:hypothetical protein
MSDARRLGSNTMKSAIIKTLVSVVAIVGATGVARAEMIGLYECTNVGVVGEDAIGDQAGHNLISLEYFCTGVDGVIKGASHLGTLVSEWTGPKGTWISAVGVTRTVGGLAVTQALEGAGTAVIKDGKFIGVEASGKAVFKFASGSLAKLSGKTYNWSSKPAPGFGRSTLELSD